MARQSAVWDIGHAVIPMPGFSIIYIKKTDKTPATTTITFTFPNGQAVDYESDNVILENLTKEYIVEKRLFPYIPFYIARYEKVILSGKDVSPAIITHITNGNKCEERLVKVMGGTIIETESEKWMRQGIQQGVQQGQAKMLIELGQEDGLEDEVILQKLQKRIGLSLEEAKACMEKFGKQLV